MLSTNPQDEIKKIDLPGVKLGDLRDRMDLTYSRFRLDEDQYVIPKTEGEWEKFISNRAKAEGLRVVGYLSSAKRKLWIPITKETKSEREKITATERLPIGTLFLADSMLDDLPDTPSIQSNLAFARIFRGWSVEIVYLSQGEEGKLRPHIRIWDARNTYWIAGAERLLWVCYETYTTADQVKDEYKGWNGKADEKTNSVKRHDIWDTEEEGVTIGGEWVKEPAKHGLDYIPVRIKAGGSIPLIHDGTHSDAIKDVGEDFFAANRDMYVYESRLLSYNMTRASQLAKAPRVVEYDSDKDPAVPDKFSKDPYVKGRTIFLDTAKGQKLVEALVPPSGIEINNMLGIAQGMESIGGLAKVQFGQIDQALPAQGIDILRQATMDVIKPFKEDMERDFVWMAMEICRQFKNGDFKEVELEGYDKSNNKFDAKIKKEDIQLKQFKCELVPDLIRDKAANIGMAKEAINSKLLSKSTAREVFTLVEDTDLEGDKIAAEGLEELAEINAWTAVVQFVKDGQPLKAQIILNKLMEMGQKPPMGNTGSPGAGVPQPGLGVANMRPPMTARRAQPMMPGGV